MKTLSELSSTSRKTLGLMAIGVSLGCALASSAPAYARAEKCKYSGQTITFPVTTTDAPGVLSTKWNVTPPSGTASVYGTSVYPGWGTPPAGISWEQSSPSAPGTAPINEAVGIYKFKTHFGPLQALSAYSSITLSGNFSVDNDGSVYLNSTANQVGYCPPTYGPPPAGFGAKCFITGHPLTAPAMSAYVPGTNTIEVKVHNNEFVSGMWIDAEVVAICN